MNKEVLNAFNEGLVEIFSTLFTDGVNDGVDFYELSEDNETNIYGEVSNKRYVFKAKLISSVTMSVEEKSEDVRIPLRKATIKVPTKCLIDNEIDFSDKALDTLKKGLFKFHDIFYDIVEVSPRTFISDSFLVYEFNCSKHLEEDDIEIVEVEDNEISDDM